MAAMRSGFFMAVFALLCAMPMRAQQQPATKSAAQAAYVPSMTFDVAVIRESKPDLVAGFTVSGANPAHNSLLKLTNHDVPNLLAVAYGVNRDQLVGLPSWVGHFGPLFNVEAKSDDSVNEQLAKLTDEQAKLEKRHMLQVLLADRFQLKTHWETKEGPIYELVIGKNGPKLHPGGSEPPTPEELRNFGDNKIPPLYQRGNGIKGYEFIGHQCPIDSLTAMLTAMMGTPVVDKTGLTGTYDFVLQYHGRTTDDASDDPDVWLPMIEAVPDQLGLKLQPAKGQKQFLVIDHIERPSAN